MRRPSVSRRHAYWACLGAVILSFTFVLPEPASSAVAVTETFTGTLAAKGRATHPIASGTGSFKSSISCSGKAKVEMKVLAPSGSVLAGTTNLCSRSPFSVSVSVPATGTYTVRLTETRGYRAPYKLTVVHPAVPTTTTTTTTATTTTTTTAVPPPQTSTPSVRVSGNKLVDQAGRTIRLLGVNFSGTEYACAQGWGIFDGPSDATSVAAIARWHTNAVRVPLNETCWLGINGVDPDHSGLIYRSAIGRYVKTLNDAGLVAVLDLHWSAPGTEIALKNRLMPNADHSPDFWRSVATYFKATPGVVFDLFNEPREVDWACWRDGCTTPTTTGWKAAGMQSLVDAVRSTGATQPVLVPGLRYANDLSKWLTYRPLDPLNQLGASFHLYKGSVCNTSACWDAEVGPVAAAVPVLTGELGQFDCAHYFIDSYMAWADAKGVSYLGWSWNTYDCAAQPALISSFDGTPTNFGIGLRDHLAALAAAP